MIERRAERHQIGIDQLTPGTRQAEGVLTQEPGDGGIGDDDQEQIQGERIGLAGSTAAVAEEALVEPAELGRNTPESFQPEEEFFHEEAGTGGAFVPRISRPLAIRRRR